MTENYPQEMKQMAILTWLSVPFLAMISLVWLYYGGKTGPWVILAFAIFQNIPWAIMYTRRYKWSLEFSKQCKEKT